MENIEFHYHKESDTSSISYTIKGESYKVPVYRACNITVLTATLEMDRFLHKNPHKIAEKFMEGQDTRAALSCAIKAIYGGF